MANQNVTLQGNSTPEDPSRDSEDEAFIRVLDANPWMRKDHTVRRLCQELDWSATDLEWFARNHGIDHDDFSLFGTHYSSVQARPRPLRYVRATLDNFVCQHDGKRLPL